jgi:hypothetical protein
MPRITPGGLEGATFGADWQKPKYRSPLWALVQGNGTIPYYNKNQTGYIKPPFPIVPS